jgi:hypothetical protein
VFPGPLGQKKPGQTRAEFLPLSDQDWGRLPRDRSLLGKLNQWSSGLNECSRDVPKKIRELPPSSSMAIFLVAAGSSARR